MSEQITSDSTSSIGADSISFKLQYGKSSTEMSLPKSATLADLKDKAHEMHSIPPTMQKLLIKGQIKPDSTTLNDAGIKKGLRVMLIGSRCVL